MVNLQSSRNSLNVTLDTLDDISKLFWKEMFGTSSVFLFFPSSFLLTQAYEFRLALSFFYPYESLTLSTKNYTVTESYNHRIIKVEKDL